MPSSPAIAVPPRPVPIMAKVPGPVVAPIASAGTFATGTKVQVGSQRVVIDRYLSEGGFAHVYLVKLPKAINGSDVAVLKRVAVPDKEALANMRTEVETMKRLKGRRHIVTYMDSHASQLKGGGYEVFLLMEYCAGGGLIDFMNTRLKNRLTEPEILEIFSDVAQGVACMHYLTPPLLHRDLKVENVLIASTGLSRRYKLCDFGSAARPVPAATSAAESRLIEEDIQKHTTLQYRSPEMIDVYRKQPIDEKSDIWALGVLLYKLCYYTTPFEEHGQLAILNASFKFPGFPLFSDKLKWLIAWMLRENPQQRPNIYQVVREACLLQGKEIPLKNIYAGKPPPASSTDQNMPIVEPRAETLLTVGASYTSPVQQQQLPIPPVIPMRRGRPNVVSQHDRHPKPSSSPLRNAAGDPFMALDMTPSPPTEPLARDDFSNRFPSLDQFSLLHDSGTRFEFDQEMPPKSSRHLHISQRVTERLADEAFAKPSPTTSGQEDQPATVANPKASPRVRPASSHSPSRVQPMSAQQPALSRPVMVSEGTMTSPSPLLLEPVTKGFRQKPRYGSIGATTSYRSSSQPRPSKIDPTNDAAPEKEKPRILPKTGPAAGSGIHRSKSQNSSAPKSSASSRPSLEEKRAPSWGASDSLTRSKEATAGRRPISLHLEPYTRDLSDHGALPPQSRSSLGKSQTLPKEKRLLSSESQGLSRPREETTIQSNVDFLRAMEDEEAAKRKEKRSSSGSKHAKRASMPSISLSNTKNLLAGKFGEAFRRFETNTSGLPVRSSSPEPMEGRKLRDLSPIAVSEATSDRSRDDHSRKAEDITPELKRDRERRELADEELRVEAAAREYRKQLAERQGSSRADNGGRPHTGSSKRATSIQNKVKALLDENTREEPVKPAHGHERTARPSPFLHPQPALPPDLSRAYREPTSKGNQSGPQEMGSSINRAEDLKTYPRLVTRSSAAVRRPASRPNAPPKPDKLRTGGIPEPVESRSPDPDPAFDRPPAPKSTEASATGAEWEMDFRSRYPSLSHLETVETDVDRVRSRPSTSTGVS